MPVAAHFSTSLPSRPVLTIRSLHKTFSGVHALKGVSFELLPGEVHALIGENGAGKSTLTKIITGMIHADSGHLEIFGQAISHNDPSISRALGVAAIYQQPSLFPHLTVAENIALALRSRNSFLVDWKSQHTQARKLIDSLGSSIDPQRLASTLTMAEQQVVEIAKAIGANAKILLMDEPTALLSQRETENLFRIIRQLRADRVGIIYISHRLEEIQEISDRITVLRDGETIDCRRADSISRSELIQLMVGRSVTSVFPKRAVPLGDTVFEISNLRNDTVGLRDITFSVRSGEIFGLAGLVGCGRTELARTLFGLTPCDTEIVVSHEGFRIRSPTDAIKLGIAYLPEDRRQHGVILEMSITENTTLAHLNAMSRWGIIHPSEEEKLAKTYLKDLRIKAPSVFSTAGTLSGGNQQKVALARWLTIHPRIMILDEPTQGVDVGSKSEIYELIMRLAENGMAVILISSELPEVLGMSDRIGVMHAGRMTGILSREEATQERIMSMALGSALQEKP